MSDESTTTTTAAETVVVETPKTTTASPPVAQVHIQKVAADAAAAALKAKADADDAAAQEAARVAAGEEQTKALDKANKHAADLEAKLASAQKAAQKQAALAALPGLKNADTFLPLVMDKIALGDDGTLTEDAKTALGSFREEYSYLFDADTATGTTPGSAAGHKTAAGQFSKEDEQILGMMNIPTSTAKNHFEKHPARKAIGWVFGMK